MNDPNAKMSTDDTIVLFRILRTAPPAEIFRNLASFYDSWSAVHEEHRREDEARECAIAREGAEMIISLLSEQSAANELRSLELIDKLRASIAASRTAAGAVA